MPTYKFTNRRVYRHRSEQRRRRLRLVALAASGLLMAGTMAMSWGRVQARLTRPVPVVQVGLPFTGAARAVVGVR